MAFDRSLTLFGFDLSRSVKYVQLGWQHLMSHPDSWLVRKFEPDVYLWEKGPYCSRYQAKQLVELDVIPPSDAILSSRIPEESVLLKNLRFPESQEIFLDQTVAMEVSACSPFPESETEFGWRVLSRSAGELHVLIAITVKTSIDQRLAQLRQQFDVDANEVWAVAPEGDVIEFPLMGKSARRERFVNSLRIQASNIAVIWLAVLVTLFIPAVMTTMRAQDISDSLAESRDAAMSAVAVRDQLQLQRERYKTILEALKDRKNYHFWLNHIAQATPNSVYFSGVSLEGNDVVVNGFAANAADYLGMLTEETAYTNVAASSAFVRDARSGLERLTITWTLQDE